ncbi:MAG: hypothetical protein NTZ52_02300 [Chlamydiae bacterium]|nr:hypothetical protein [Chlamydiota bacterium]
MNLLLFGFKQCGKTYLGLRVAQKMQMHFIDTNHMIEHLFTARYHKILTCQEIIHHHGVHFFSELEKQVIYSLENTKNTVIALGSEAVLDQTNVDHLVKIGTLVYLETDKEILERRMFSLELPPAIDRKDLQASFKAMYENRSLIYQHIPSLVINTGHHAEEHIIKMLRDIVSSSQKKSS